MGDKQQKQEKIRHDHIERLKKLELDKVLCNDVEKYYKIIAEGTTDLVAIADLEGNYRYVSPSHDTMGYEPEDLLGKSGFDFLHPDDVAELLPFLDDALTNGDEKKDSKRVEFRVKDKEGKWRHYESTVNLIRDEEGNPLSLLFVSRDVTERKHMEQALAESEEKYRTFVERANDGIVIIKDGLVKYVNPILEEQFGYKMGEIIDKPYLEMVHPDELERLSEFYRKRLAGEEVPSIYETKLMRKDGSVMFAELNAGLISYEGGVGDLVFVRDITNRKNAETALRESEEKYRNVVEGGSEAILVAQDGEIKFINRKAYKLMKYSKKELLDKNFLEFIHPDDPECVDIRYVRKTLKSF